MPLDLSVPDHVARLSQLNVCATDLTPEAILSLALEDPDTGPLALVSSFGAESVVLLHMVSRVARGLPVLFLDTEMLFPETLSYQREVADKLGLMDVRVIRPDRREVIEQDNENLLHLYDTDACCALRKARPLERALAPFSGWISGRKRFQGAARADLPAFEVDGAGRLKVNPLAGMGRDAVASYIDSHRLPRHPLVSRGYPSIGCMPCTNPVGFGGDSRAGRWEGQAKTECGIHFSSIKNSGDRA